MMKLLSERMSTTATKKRIRTPALWTILGDYANGVARLEGDLALSQMNHKRMAECLEQSDATCANLEEENDALKRENKGLLDGIHNARHCLTHGRNTTPTEGERFDIGTTYTKLSILLTAEEYEQPLCKSERAL